MALAELATGLLAVLPRTRRVSAVLALVLHGGVAISMARVGPAWNPAVRPWNVALACAGLALIASWREPFRETVARSRPLVRVVVVLLLVTPGGWFVGLTDAYLAHHLYSADTPRAAYRGAGATWSAFNVPLPPEHRLYEQSFGLICAPGETLTITETRWWFRVRGQDRKRLLCPRTDAPRP